MHSIPHAESPVTDFRTRMQVSKRIPMEDPQTLMLIRAGYVLSNVVIISIYAYVHFLINKKKGAYL
jgi:Phosphate transport (Pho88)